MIDKITFQQRRKILVVADICVTLFSVAASISVFYGPVEACNILLQNPLILPVYLLIRLLTFERYGLYSFSWRYASTKEFINIVRGVSVSSFLIISTLLLSNVFTLPKIVFLIEFCFNMLLTGSLRVVLRLYREYLNSKMEKAQSSADKVRVLIVGAGDAGAMMAREIQRVSSLNYDLVGFVDDNPSKQRQIIHQVPVLGRIQTLVNNVEDYQVEEVIIAMPSANGASIRDIMTLCETAQVKVKITPGLSDIIGGKISVSQLREVRIEDLLGRDVVNLESELISGHIEGAVVLVTGAGGSIGSELCRQLLTYNPQTLLVLDQNEFSTYKIDMELQQLAPDSVKVVPLVVDVTHKDRLERVFSTYRPTIVFHAAAHKHVPLMELNVEEVVENNILGTKQCLALSDQYQARNFVLISTDKAVRPTNCMGATKRLCEVLLQIQAKKSKHTKFSAVRFGNVLGSQGSVIPLFREQIKKGGPVTVTHQDITRYFMTIPEAVSLVIQTCTLSQGGEMYILDMGKPVKIIELAKDMIQLSGFEEGQDIDIEITGLRPGEKLYEELFFDKSMLAQTPHDKIFVTQPSPFDDQLISSRITALIEKTHSGSPEAIKQELLDLVTLVDPKTKEKVGELVHDH